MINCDQLSVNRLVLAKAVKAAHAMVPPQAMMQNRSNAQPTAAMQTKSNLQNQQAMNKQTPDEKYRLPKNQEEAKAMRNGTQYSSKVQGDGGGCSHWEDGRSSASDASNVSSHTQRNAMRADTAGKQMESSKKSKGASKKNSEKGRKFVCPSCKESHLLFYWPSDGNL